MAGYIATLEQIRSASSGKWSDRITSELAYVHKMCTKDKLDTSVLAKCIDFLSNKFSDDGAITNDSALKCEEMLASEYSENAKKYTLSCIGHAHIDMNWQWGFNETVAITLDTFETMLALMEEYEDFTFMQSQASVYEIVEEHAPEMLEQIKQRIKEGRWDVIASQWVEGDKNIPNGESLSRHLLYTRQYLSQLLDIDPESMNIDFEPDTFGHSAQVPEILTKGHVDYYYHCRGFDKYSLYRWQAPSGKTITVFREPTWYNGEALEYSALSAMDFYEETGMDTFLWVYGVGDHGGGPTRRDISKIIEMNSWPVFPNFKFDTMSNFFPMTEAVKDSLPVVDSELNFIFTGCYTTQTRIKMGNKICEDMLYQSEALNAFAKDSGYKYSNKAYQKAWKKVLFNQFHDIIPGSGVIETREYAMALYQEAMATANTRRAMSLKAIAKNIDTSSIDKKEDISQTRSEGAGVGKGIEKFTVSQVGRGAGQRRIFHIFNPSPYKRNDVVEVTVWDWVVDVDPLSFLSGDLRGIASGFFKEALKQVAFYDQDNKEIPFQIINNGIDHYWGHTYLKALVQLDVPANGYTTCYLDKKEPTAISYTQWTDPRTDSYPKPVLENDMLKVEFDANTAEIVSLYDKTSDTELVPEGQTTGIFRFIHEDTAYGMTSWRVGRYMQIDNLHKYDVKITGLQQQGLQKSITYTVKFERSTLDVKVYIENNSPMVKFDVKCHFMETGSKETYIPQLNFYAPFAFDAETAVFDIPMGSVTRGISGDDVPANGFCMANNENGPSFFVGSDCKHGFRFNGDSVGVTLIRGSYDPDPEPELFTHNIKLAIAPVNSDNVKAPFELSDAVRHSLIVASGSAQEGKFAMTNSFMELVKGDVIIQAVKKAENSDKIIVRGYSLSDTKQEIAIKFDSKYSSVKFVDIMEIDIDCEAPTINGDVVTANIPAFDVFNIALK